MRMPTKADARTAVRKRVETQRDNCLKKFQHTRMAQPPGEAIDICFFGQGARDLDLKLVNLGES